MEGLIIFCRAGFAGSIDCVDPAAGTKSGDGKYTGVGLDRLGGVFVFLFYEVGAICYLVIGDLVNCYMGTSNKKQKNVKH